MVCLDKIYGYYGLSIAKCMHEFKKIKLKGLRKGPEWQRGTRNELVDNIEG